MTLTRQKLLKTYSRASKKQQCQAWTGPGGCRGDLRMGEASFEKTGYHEGWIA